MAEKKTPKAANPAAKKAGGEAATLAKIALMRGPFRCLGERLHALVLRSAPSLQPTPWYGIPAYAKGGINVCFFRADKKYMTFGFTQEANLTWEQSGPHQLIPCAWYFTSLDAASEAELSAIVRRAAG